MLQLLPSLLNLFFGQISELALSFLCCFCMFVSICVPSTALFCVMWCSIVFYFWLSWLKERFVRDISKHLARNKQHLMMLTANFCCSAPCKWWLISEFYRGRRKLEWPFLCRRSIWRCCIVIVWAIKNGILFNTTEGTLGIREFWFCWFSVTVISKPWV